MQLHVTVTVRAADADTEMAIQLLLLLRKDGVSLTPGQALNMLPWLKIQRLWLQVSRDSDSWNDILSVARLLTRAA